MKPLRAWQRECIDHAMQRYTCGQQHFLCVATPGAGKTTMASTLASFLLKSGRVDLVICFSPSVAVCSDFRDELEKQTGSSFDGLLGSKGRCLTYHGMLYESDRFWNLFRTQRVFVIFDEIHHCAGNGDTDGNAWGNEIVANIQGVAAYTLALSGTPWRSDGCPVTLLSYTEQGAIRIDYEYTLARAIGDGVCKSPVITLIDNGSIKFESAGIQSSYASIKALMENETVSYFDILDTKDVILFTLRLAHQKLLTLRNLHPRAGGVVICASIAHAHKVQQVLTEIAGDIPALVTSLSEDAQDIIGRYRNGSAPWIVSVGMISEGTNIPRLSVCAHLSRIRTELYFRQVLGRVLRKDGSRIDNGYLYVPSDETMEMHAESIMNEMPSLKPGVCSVTRTLEDPHERTEKTSQQANIRMDESSRNLCDGSGEIIKSVNLLAKNYVASIAFGADFVSKDICFSFV